MVKNEGVSLEQALSAEASIGFRGVEGGGGGGRQHMTEDVLVEVTVGAVGAVGAVAVAGAVPAERGGREEASDGLRAFSSAYA